MIKQLLEYARKEKRKLIKTNAIEIIKQVIEFSKHSFGKKYKIENNIVLDNAIIIGDSTQLFNSFLNVFINAKDSMPKGGKINVDVNISTFIKKIKYKDFGELVPGKYILIEIKDNGTGMSNHVMKQIYEPFFTTKTKGRGTGLGMSAAFGIIKSHHGMIKIYSKVNVGTTIKIFLPLS